MEVAFGAALLRFWYPALDVNRLAGAGDLGLAAILDAEQH
jgi:hypothetical protein